MDQCRTASRAVLLTVMGLVVGGGGMLAPSAATAATAAAVAAAQQPAQQQGVRVGGPIKPPAILKRVNPVYPEDARAARVQGVVIVEATIGANGTVADARVLRSVPMLDQAALDAVRQWVYEPTQLNGVAVPVIMTVTVNFSLGLPESESKAKSVTLEVTDTKGTVVLVKDATVNYADPAMSGSAAAPTAPAVSHEGIRVYQGEGQTTVKWSAITSLTFTSADKTGTPARIKGELVLASGRRMATMFVLPGKGGGLRGTTELGAYTIAFSDIAQIAPMPAATPEIEK